MQVKNRTLFSVLFLLALAFRLYGFFDHWKDRDHYNFGGPFNMALVQCLHETPWSISMGIPHFNCETHDQNKFVYYRNHPMFLYWGLYLWTILWGMSEAVLRSFTLLFSMLNIFLVFRLATRLWPDPQNLQPKLALFFQCFFLGTIYFGTHVDMPAEYTGTFWLLVSLAIVSESWWWGIFAALFAGFTDWPGFLFLFPMGLLALILAKHRVKMIIACFLAAGLILFIMSYMQQTLNLWDWFKLKMSASEYASATHNEEGLRSLPIVVHGLLQHFSRLLGPAFAGLFFSAIATKISGIKVETWRAKLSESPKLQVYFLWCTTLIVLLFIGTRYVLMHLFWLMPFMPIMALMCAEQSLLVFEKKSRMWIFLGVLALGIYPYGIYKSNVVQDAVNSLILGGSALYFIFAKKTWRNLALVFGLTALGNFSQVVNYRNEPDTQFEVCRQANEYYTATGKTFQTNHESTLATNIYCRGIPVEFGVQSPSSK